MKRLLLAALCTVGCSLSRDFASYSSEFDGAVATSDDAGIDTAREDDAIDSFVAEESGPPEMDTAPPIDTFVPDVPPEPIGQRLYVIAGARGSLSSPMPTNTVWSARIAADGGLESWKTQPPLPESSGCMQQAATVQGGVLFVSGGLLGSGAVASRVHRSNGSATGALSPWASSTMDRPRYAHGMVYLNGSLHVVGGRASTTEWLDTMVRSVVTGGVPSASWIVGTGRLGEPISNHATVAYSNSLWTFGGLKGDGSQEIGVWRFLVAGDGSVDGVRYVQASANLGMRAFHQGFGLDNRFYVIGGSIGATRASAKVDIATLGTAVAPFKPSVFTMPQPRMGHAVFLHGRRVYVVGGADDAGNATKDVFVGTVRESDGELFWETKTEWSLPEPRVFASAVVN